MLFVLISLVFVFIAYVAFFGECNKKELQKEIKEYESVTGFKYK